MTKYRTKYDGYQHFLQYIKVYNILGLKLSFWRYVPKPYYTESFGRNSIFTMNYEKFICSTTNYFDYFIKDNPDIKNYLINFKKEQKILKTDVIRKKKEHNKSIGKTELLN